MVFWFNDPSTYEHTAPIFGVKHPMKFIDSAFFSSFLVLNGHSQCGCLFYMFAVFLYNQLLSQLDSILPCRQRIIFIRNLGTNLPAYTLSQPTKIQGELSLTVNQATIIQ